MFNDSLENRLTLIYMMHFRLAVLHRIPEESSKYFVLQKRRGHDEPRGLVSLAMSTIDTIFDTKPAPYRIIHQTPSSEVSYGN